MAESLFDLPTRRIADLCDRTEAALRILSRSLAGPAARHAEAAVPPETLRLATRLLADARRVLSRQPGVAGLLLTPPALTYAELAPLLALATESLAAYRTRFSLPGGGWDWR